jgi:hypothetical protein
MPAIWQVRVKSAAGALVSVLTGGEKGFKSFSFTRRVNTPGSYALLMAKAADETDAAFQARTADLFALDGQIEFWRRWPEMGIDWRLEFEAFHRTPDWYVTKEGELVYQSAGRGYLDLLNRAVIDAYAGTAGSGKSGAAETVLKAFVDEQLVNPTDASRGRAGLSIAADGGGGNSVELKRAWKGVLEVCQEIARIGGGDFEIVGTGAATFELRWHTGQLGTDRSASVVFAYERGNMSSPHLTYARHDEVNAVLVGGQGEGEGRATVWRTTAGLIDDSTWNRCEVFRNATNETTTAGLNAVGDALLDEGKPRYTLAFEPIQTPGCLYGADYFFGDLTGARFLSYDGIQKVQEVTFMVNEDAQDVHVKLEEV